jgi:hypothetical protein
MTLSDFQNKHIGCHAFIIGKGPSLDRIEEIKESLTQPEAIIFCVNESIHKLESLGGRIRWRLYAVQQDSELEYDCIPKHPLSVHFMNNFQHSPQSKRKEIVKVSPWNPNAILYGYPEICGNTTLTALAAVKLAKYIGIAKVSFCCFDSWSNGWQGSGEYAKCIGKESGVTSGVKRHATHGCHILQEAVRIMTDVEIVFPERIPIKSLLK